MERGKYKFGEDFQDLTFQNKLEDDYVYTEWFIRTMELQKILIFHKWIGYKRVHWYLKSGIHVV